MWLQGELPSRTMAFQLSGSPSSCTTKARSFSIIQTSVIHCTVKYASMPLSNTPKDRKTNKPIETLSPNFKGPSHLG